MSVCFKRPQTGALLQLNGMRGENNLFQIEPDKQFFTEEHVGLDNLFCIFNYLFIFPHQSTLSAP